MRIPDVIHAGFPKCASTFLQSYFDQHADVFMVFKGEFLSPFEHPEGRGPNEQEYLARFKSAGKDQLTIESDEHILLPLCHPVLGIRAMTRESTREVFNRMAEFAPQAKLLLVIRNQTDMIISAFSQYVLAGGTMRINEFASELLQSSRDGQNYLCMFFDEVCELAISRYENRVLVLLLEDFRRDQDGQLARLTQFLKISDHRFRDSFKARRIGLSANAMRLTRRLNQFLARGERGPVKQRYWIPQSAYRLLCNILRVADHYVLSHFFRASKRSLLDLPTQQLIQQTFEQDNSRLANRLSRNLETLGYACRADKVTTPPADRQTATGSH